MHSQVKYLIVGGITTILIGCGDGSTYSPSADNSKINLSGNLGNSYAYYQEPWYHKLFPKLYAQVFGHIEKAIAIPIINGNAELRFLKNVTINSDGSFTISLEKSFTGPDNKKYPANWILLLVKEDGTYDFLSIPNNDNSESLINLPISNATEDIDVGNINPSQNSEAHTTLNLNDLSTKVTYNINQLEKFSQLDDILKSIANEYRNKNSKTRYVLHIVSKGNYNEINTTYSLASQFQGYAFHFHSKKGSKISQNFTNLCNNNKSLKLYPPINSSILVGNQEYNNSYPLVTSGGNITTMTSGEQECGGNNSYFRKDTDGSVVTNIITGDNSNSLGKTIPIPNGLFTLKLQNDIIGLYNLSYNLPVITDSNNNKHTKVPTPKIKLELDSNNKVKGVYVKWYLYSKTSGYSEISPEIMKKFTSDYSIHIDDYSGINGNNSRLEIHCRKINLDTNYVDISKCENYPSSGIFYNYNQEDKYSLDDININIDIASSEFRFTYRKNSN